DKPAAPTPTAAARCNTPRPQSTRNACPPARTRVDGPARFGSGIGLPVPSRVISIMVPSLQGGLVRSGDSRHVRAAGLGVGSLLAACPRVAFPPRELAVACVNQITTGGRL